MYVYFHAETKTSQKTQENKKLIVSNDAGKKLEALVKDNARRLQDLTAECQRFQIEMQEVRAP